MRRRSHPRRRNRLSVVMIILIVLLLTSVIIPAGSFSTASVSRSSTFNVVSDAEGSHNLAISSSVPVGQTNRLVTVTNNLGTDVTVEVQLRSDSIDKGDLVINGVVVGDQSSFSLAAGSSQSVDIEVTSNTTLVDERIYFHVNASGTGLTVNAPNRYTTITQ